MKNVEQEESVFQTEENIWFYVLNGERKGPVSEAELLRLLEARYIHGDTMIWKQGLPDWLPVTRSGIVIEKRDEIVEKKVGNISIVLLLFVPVISSLIQYLIAGSFQVSADKLLWIVAALNIFCCTFDYYRVKKAGYDTDRLNTALLLFVPLYIYKRMALVNGKKWAFTLIWTTVLVLDILIPAEFWVKAINMSNPAMITVVKESSFSGAEDTTVEKMFVNALDHCQWSTYMGSNREILVQVEGVLEIKGDEDDPEDAVCTLETVFEIDMASSCEVISMKEDGVEYSDDEITTMLTYLRDAG